MKGENGRRKPSVGNGGRSSGWVLTERQLPFPPQGDNVTPRERARGKLLSGPERGTFSILVFLWPQNQKREKRAGWGGREERATSEKTPSWKSSARNPCLQAGGCAVPLWPPRALGPSLGRGPNHTPLGLGGNGANSRLRLLYCEHLSPVPATVWESFLRRPHGVPPCSQHPSTAHCPPPTLTPPEPPCVSF